MKCIDEVPQKNEKIPALMNKPNLSRSVRYSPQNDSAKNVAGVEGSWNYAVEEHWVFGGDGCC